MREIQNSKIQIFAGAGVLFNDYEGFRVAFEHFVLFEQMNINEKGTKTTYLPVFDVGID